MLSVLARQVFLAKTPGSQRATEPYDDGRSREHPDRRSVVRDRSRVGEVACLAALPRAPARGLPVLRQRASVRAPGTSFEALALALRSVARELAQALARTERLRLLLLLRRRCSGDAAGSREAYSRSKPVAITVIFTSSPMASFSTTPKLICTSSFSAASRISVQASFTSCRPRRAGAGDVDQHAARAAHAAGFHQRATDGLLRRDHGRVFARSPTRCPSSRSPCRA